MLPLKFMSERLLRNRFKAQMRLSPFYNVSPVPNRFGELTETPQIKARFGRDSALYTKARWRRLDAAWRIGVHEPDIKTAGCH